MTTKVTVEAAADHDVVLIMTDKAKNDAPVWSRLLEAGKTEAIYVHGSLALLVTEV